MAPRTNFNNFSGGKVSDSNPVNPPENSARTLLNIDVQLSGKVGRRLGLEPERNFNLPIDVNNESTDWLDGYTLDAIQALGIDVYIWKSVDNQPGINYRVVRIGNTLYVYSEAGSVLSNSLVRVVDISSHAATTAVEAEQGGFQATSGKGLLLCCGESYDPFYVKYDSTDDEWSTNSITIQIRDFEGVDDGYTNDDYRPPTLTNDHRYNLHNQGWPQTVRRDTNGHAELPHIHFFNQYATFGVYNYPSNADIWYFGQTPDGTLFKFNAHEMESQFFGNTPAPKGHFIINPFETNARFKASGVVVSDGQDIGVIEKRPKSIAFFAGRVWYASLQGVIFFSKIIESEDDLGKCYQEQDPTAEDLNALLATDGGTIKILDMGEAEGMSILADSLCVFGTAGVWSISGGDQGFTANNILLTNVSKVKITNYRSIVATESAVFFWTEEGIFVISNNNLGDIVAESLTENKIQRDYNAIPSAAKAYCQGTYDRINRRVYWSYSFYTQDDSSDIKHKYTNVLIFNILTRAFWDYTLSNEGFTSASTAYPIMCGLFSTDLLSAKYVTENVTDGGTIVTASGDNVTVSVLSVSSSTLESPLKAMLLLPDASGDLSLTFGQFSSRTFNDWAGLDTNDILSNTNYASGFPAAVRASGNYSSVVETLPLTLGEPSVKKEIGYVYTYFDYIREGYNELTIPDEFDT